MRIRNLVLHGVELEEYEALESLAAFSLLARWVESAELVATDGPEQPTGDHIG